MPFPTVIKLSIQRQD